MLAALEDGCTLITVGVLAVQKMEKSWFSYAERECGAKYMGKPDILTKEYMKQPSVFADVFNQFLYHGRQVIASGNLVELDTTEISVPYGADSASVPEQRYRDVSKMLVSMTDGTVAYCILAVENETKVNYAMPIKNGLYDFLQLAHQVTNAAVSHRKAKEGSP